MAKTQIMVVEDDGIVVIELQDRLQSLGYAVCAVASYGEEAVEKAAEARPNLVLMDIRLKGAMSGIEAAEQIHARFDIPVIYLTAYADEATLQRAKVTEPYGYILKPFEERELRTAIEMALYKHEMERKLKESERWLATTLRSIGDAVIATDAKGCVVFMNPVAEALTGRKQEEALGRDLTKVFHIINEETRTVIESPIKRALQEGCVVGLADHSILIAKDGREIPVDDSTAPIRDDKGDVTGAVLVFRDITERKRAEEERRELQARLFQAQKMEAIGILAGGIAHDFNNLLTIIIGYGQLLLQQLDSRDPLRDDIEQIKEAGERAALLVRQLLAFSRKQMLQQKVLDLNAVVADTRTMLQSVIGEDISLVTVLESRLRYVKADPKQIQQIIKNLVGNACDAMPWGGKLTIKTENVTLDEEQCQVIPDARPGKFVCLSLTDTGVGMDEEIIEHIFEPFFTTKEVGKGTGLGLSVVYGTVKQHGGWINVYSGPRQGTTFKIYLPVVSVKPEDESGETIPLQELRYHSEQILRR